MPQLPHLPRSIRKHIRRRKAELRRQFTDPAEHKAKIAELVSGFRGQYPKGKGPQVIASGEMKPPGE